MWMGLRGSRLVAKKVIGEPEPGAKAFGRRLEHMFVSLRTASDGIGGRGSAAPARFRSYARDPREDQISSLVRARSTTSSVNSLVVALPCKSGVFRPAAIVSSAAS